MPSTLDQIETLARSISNEANKLIRENELRMQQTDSPETATGDVPWADFESAATAKIGFSDLGWKSEFERQIGFKEGVLKGWNQRGMVPQGFLQLCDILKAVSKPKAAKVPWSPEENQALRDYHGRGLRGTKLRKAMREQFGDRRDYMRDGPVFGACQRLGLKDG